MFWIAICFLLFLIWGGTSLIKAAANYTPRDPDALNPDTERAKFESAVKDYSRDCKNRIKATMKRSDLWDFLGREPSEEEVKALNAPFLFIDDLVLNALMSREGKLDTLFLMNRHYPTTNPIQRALVEETYLKIEDTLEAKGIHNVVTVENVTGMSRTLVCLRDLVKTSGYGHTGCSDDFKFANMEFANPGVAMNYLRNKK